MPETEFLQKADVVILSTEIGRGHPSYLDGIVETLNNKYKEISYLKTNVSDLSGGISRAAWRLVRKLYSLGGRGGVISALYGSMRKVSASGEGGGLVYNFLGRDIKKSLSDYAGPVVVAHPIVARILSGVNRVIYQHGELAAPDEAIVRGCEKLLVPLKETEQIFKRARIVENKIIVTGQCVETGLVPLARTAFDKRMERLNGDQPLTVALFSSGAYPRDHLNILRQASLSLFRSGHNMVLFMGSSQKIADHFRGYFRKNKIAVGTDLTDEARVKVICSAGRSDENRQVASIFDQIDFFIAPAHERVNWCVGLGLPQFIIRPYIGSYASLNARIIIDRGVAREIENEAQASDLGGIVANLRGAGKLVEMARNGYGHSQISGFDTCAKVLAGMVKRLK